MNNMVKVARAEIDALIQKAYENAVKNGTLKAESVNQGAIEIPRDTAHGDFASSFAMVNAKKLGQNPRAIAQMILDQINLSESLFEKAEIAGPGFLNFFFGNAWYEKVLFAIEAQGKDYGKSGEKRDQRVMVEFVSANPTGPMHIGNARGGVLGDTLANVLSLDGYDTYKEFYVNDTGNQIQKFATSIDARYRQIVFGEENVPFPEEGYHGDDIKHLAQRLFDLHGDGLTKQDEQTRREEMAKFGLSQNIPKMQEDLKHYGIEYDEWFLESSLHESGYLEDTVNKLTSAGWTYEKDDALWLNTTALLTQKYLAEGKTQEQIDNLELKDDVLRRGNGVYTYFAADIAYHRNKLQVRGFDKVINIWGADHHGHVARLQAALDGIGLDGSNRLVWC